MPRVVPSDVVKAADRMFPGMVQAATTFTAVGPDTVPRLMALAHLVDAVAPELVTLEPERYAALVANVAYIRAMGGAFQAGQALVRSASTRRAHPNIEVQPSGSGRSG